MNTYSLCLTSELAAYYSFTGRKSKPGVQSGHATGGLYACLNGDAMTDERRKSSMWNICPPPGIDRMRELTYRDHYARERACAVEHDEAEGVTWPVDLGEAGA